MSLRAVLAETLIGAPGSVLEWSEVSDYLRRHYVDSKDEQERRDEHRKRWDYYSDGGVSHIESLIDRVYVDPDVRAKRKVFVRTARFNNVVKRIVNELSKTYSEPARRTVGGSEDNQRRYALALERLRMTERSREIDRRLNLHRAVVVGVRVRNIGTVDDPVNTPVLDVISPADCFLVVHPADPASVVGYGVRLATRYARSDSRVPSWVVWGSRERIYLDEKGYLIEGGVAENQLGRAPFVHLTLDPPGPGGWPGSSGADLVAAHEATWYAGLSLLKEAKSANKQAVISGDLTHIARNQAADSEVPIEIGDGTAVSTLDTSMDLSLYRDVADHVIEHVANSYGMSAALIKHQGVQSAEARDLMRVPLREMRLEQHALYREFERDVAHLMADVFRVDMPELAFDPVDWSIDFADPQTPRSPKEQLELFEHARRLSLDSTIAFVVRQNPDLTRDQARDLVLAFIEDELWRNRAMRPLLAASGSMRTDIPGPPGDEDNDSAPPAATGDEAAAA